MPERRAVAVLSGGLDSTTMAYWLRAAGLRDRGHFVRLRTATPQGTGVRGADLLRSRRALDADRPARGGTDECARRVSVDRRQPSPFPTGTTPTRACGSPWCRIATRSCSASRARSRSRVTPRPLRSARTRVTTSSTRIAGRSSFVRSRRWSISPSKDFASIDILTPFLAMTKAEIVKLGNELGVPFERTWSCYKGGAVHCGTCGTCNERREAFALAQGWWTRHRRRNAERRSAQSQQLGARCRRHRDEC